MDSIQNKSGQLTDDQLFGGEPPLVCSGYLPDDVRRQLARRDAGVKTCAAYGCPCPALNEHTGECEASTCIVEMQRFSMEAM